MSIPPVDRAMLPPDIRDAAPARREAYTAALGFEQVLMGQLARTMLPESASGYASLLPDALSGQLAAAGGLGLARSLADAVAPAQEEPQP
jgi:Rod binding domain-containing protein